MLSDFLTLEVYFGGTDSAQELEAAYRKYGRKAVEEALRVGDLAMSLPAGASKLAQPLCWLSEAGRRKAQNRI